MLARQGGAAAAQVIRALGDKGGVGWGVWDHGRPWRNPIMLSEQGLDGPLCCRRFAFLLSHPSACPPPSPPHSAHSPPAGAVRLLQRSWLGELVHIFSHIRMTLKAERIVLEVGLQQGGAIGIAALS